MKPPASQQVLRVALREGEEVESKGRTWTAEDYSQRDAKLAELGIRFGKPK